jgi:hypothetical protein
MLRSRVMPRLRLRSRLRLKSMLRPKPRLRLMLRNRQLYNPYMGSYNSIEYLKYGQMNCCPHNYIFSQK